MADLKPMVLTVVTPDDKAFEAKVKFISGRALDGDFGFYPNPAPHVVALDIAELDVTDQDDKKYKLAIFGGFLEIDKNQATLVTPSCEVPESIDPERAQRARQRAEERLAADRDDVDVPRARAALKRALLRIDITSGL
ncbi:MAG: ATP synthase F1 subunit epsilon [Veillonella sp.]|nr:ATP synthase F1 subunit epsilon [Veillonella sp.]